MSIPSHGSSGGAGISPELLHENRMKTPNIINSVFFIFILTNGYQLGK